MPWISAVRSEPAVTHLYARALLDQGRAVDALAAEGRVLDACAAASEREDERGHLGAEGETGKLTCDAWLVASATRRADILAQLVELGIEDANAHPEVTAVAYHKATREARLAIR